MVGIEELTRPQPCPDWAGLTKDTLELHHGNVAICGVEGRQCYLLAGSQKRGVTVVLERLWLILKAGSISTPKSLH